MSTSRDRSLLIFPCNGNGLEALDCLTEGDRFLGFVDDAREKLGRRIAGFPVLDRSALVTFPSAAVLAVPGSPSSFRARRQIIERLLDDHDRFTKILHPSAMVSRRAMLGRNVLVMAGAVIAGNATIGDHVCVLPNTVIHHDAVVQNWSLIGSSVVLAGGVVVEENCYVGSGSSIKQGVRVGASSLVGLGSTVVRDVAPGSVVAGNPARSLHGPKDAR
jgi:sugar O-acyltransferase (sialic acid O-acetyltransferase NeuD family)